MTLQRKDIKPGDRLIVKTFNRALRVIVNEIDGEGIYTSFGFVPWSNVEQFATRDTGDA